MKIADGVVIDPRRKGITEMPFLSLLWESEPVETAPPSCLDVDIDDGTVRLDVATFGSFYELRPTTDEPVSLNIGKLNTQGVFPEPLVPVLVSTERADQARPMFVPVGRARRLVRKWGQDRFDLVVNDFAARKGEVLWSIEPKNPACLGRVQETRFPCPDGPKHIVENGTYVTWPLCERHHQIWNRKAAARRAAAKV